MVTWPTATFENRWYNGENIVSLIAHQFRLESYYGFLTATSIFHFIKTGDHVVFELVKVPEGHEEGDPA